MTAPGDRNVLPILWLAGIVAIGCWYATCFAPQRSALTALLDMTATEVGEQATIRSTLARADGIRRARADVLSRLAADKSGNGPAIQPMLLALDRDARAQGISIVSISPSTPQVESQATTLQPVAETSLTVSLEGPFERILRFLENANASGALLDIGDVRLNAERLKGTHEILLAQVDVRSYRFRLPR